MNPPSENNYARRGQSGSDPSTPLDRLLRSASKVPNDAPPETPFGFDTRVVALWRAGSSNGNYGLARLVRRVAILALGAIIVSSVAGVYEMKQARETSELEANEYAIADSAIESEFPQ